MPDFNELHEHARKLADLTAPGQQEPGLITWNTIVGEEWRSIVELWRGCPAPSVYDRQQKSTSVDFDGTEGTELFTPDSCRARLSSRRPEDAGGELEQQVPAGQIERPEVINIDARYAVVHQRDGEKPRSTMCANCGIRYELTDDPIQNHHRAMAHKQVCRPPAGTIYGEEQREQLVAEFEQQPMQREFRERAAVALAAGVDAQTLRLTGVSLFGEHPKVAALRELGAAASEAINETAPPRRWWKFWRWFK